MGLKCLIIDDDPMICDLVKYFCTKIKEIEYCISAGTGRDGLELLSSQAIDLVFLDYNLPDMKGQGLLELKQNALPVIMVTSETDFATKSYEYHDIIDYLVKPISFDRFQKGIKKALGQLESQIKLNLKNNKEALFVKDGNKWVRIQFSSLLFLKSEENYVAFATAEKTTLSLITLKEIESKLPEHFLKVHRSYIVNLDKIDVLTTDELIINKITIPIGQTYRKEVMEYINRT